jgi:5-methylcytosine-specific restriction endonuclease McrA
MYKPIEGTCLHCGKTYIGNPDSKYCGYGCSHASRKRRVTLVCQECGREFERQEWNSNAKFCSCECTYKNMSSNIIEVVCTNCKQVFLRKSHRANRAASGNNFCSRKCLYIYNRGGNHYEWKEDIRELYPKDALNKWAAIIKKRDNYTCQLCGETNKKLLEAHHIKSKRDFPELTLNFDNGVTLCLKCHLIQHSNDVHAANLIMCKIVKYERQHQEEST